MLAKGKIKKDVVDVIFELRSLRADAVHLPNRAIEQRDVERFENIAAAMEGFFLGLANAEAEKKKEVGEVATEKQ